MPSKSGKSHNPQPWIVHYLPRAVAPPLDILSPRDIYEAGTDMYLSYPSNFGQGMSIVPDSNPPIPCLLYYVSTREAEDRNPTIDPAITLGGNPGWYVVASTGQTFQVHLSALNGNKSASRLTSHSQQTSGHLNTSCDIDAIIVEVLATVFINLPTV